MSSSRQSRQHLCCRDERDCLTAQLAQASEMRQLADDLRRDTVIRCESAIAMHQASEAQLAQAKARIAALGVEDDEMDQLYLEERRKLIVALDTANAENDRLRECIDSVHKKFCDGIDCEICALCAPPLAKEPDNA